MKIRFFHALCIIIITHISTSAYSKDVVDLPLLGNPERVEFSRFDEKVAGQRFMSQILAFTHVSNDPILTQYLYDLGTQITNASDHVGRDFDFFMVVDNSINAFAGPDGRIGIHAGLIVNARSEEELIAVIAHEVAHVTQNHIARPLLNSRKNETPSLLAGLALLIAGIYSDNADLSAAGIYGSIALQYDSFLANTRLFELEADRKGQVYLERAGYSSQAMPSFFARLSRFDTGNLPVYLRTHPLTQNRLKEAIERSENQSDFPLKEQLTFQLVQARTAFVTGREIDSTYSLASREYYQALVWHQNKNPKLKEWLATKLRKHLFYDLLALESDLLNEDEKKHLFEQLYLSNPYHLAIQSLSMRFVKSPETLIKRYHENIQTTAKPAFTYNLLAKAYDRNNDRVHSLFYKARAFEQTGHIRKSLTFIEEAKNASDNNTFKTRMDSESARLKQFLEYN